METKAPSISVPPPPRTLIIAPAIIDIAPAAPSAILPELALEHIFPAMSLTILTAFLAHVLLAQSLISISTSLLSLVSEYLLIRCAISRNSCLTLTCIFSNSVVI